MGLLTESDFMSVTDLNQTVRFIGHELTFILSCTRIFMIIVSFACLISWSWELFLVAYDWKSTKT